MSVENVGSIGGKGLVAFSFALREQEPNPCNQRLGNAVVKIAMGEQTPIEVAAQWEIAKALENTEVAVGHVINLKEDGSYLDTVGVWTSARDHFDKLGISKIIPVAHPYIHLPYVKRMIKKDGFEVVSRSIGRIGFDNSELNTQPWTRSRFAFTAQTVKLVLLDKKHGHDGMQSES